MKTSNKTIKQIMIILFLPFIISVINSCFWNSEEPEYIIESMIATPQRILGIDTVGSNQLLKYRVNDLLNNTDSIIIQYDSLGISVSAECVLANTGINLNAIGFQSVYAWSRSKDWENLIDVIITSDNDYDSNYPRGSDLTDIISFHIAHLTRSYSVAQFVQEYVSGDSSFLIRFNSPPANDAKHNIVISCLTENGNKFDLTVNNLLICK